MVMTYEQIFAVDENNPQNVAANSSILIFDPAVPGVAITITDPTGAPLANPVPTNAKGFGSAFAHATLDRVGWSGGGFTGYFTSYDGMKNVAVAAQAAAEAAGATAAAAASAGVAGVSANADAAAASAAASATAAANSAALVGAPADSAIAAAVNNGASATKAALNATFASKIGSPIPVLEMVKPYSFGDSYGSNPNQGADTGTLWVNRLTARHRMQSLSQFAVAGTRMDQILSAIQTSWPANGRGLVFFSDGCINDEKQYTDTTGTSTTAEAFRSALAYLTSRAVQTATGSAFVYGPNWTAAASSTVGAYADFAFNGDKAYLLLNFVTGAGGTLTIKNAAGATVATATTGGYKQNFTGAVKLTGLGAGDHTVRLSLSSGSVTVAGAIIPSATPPVIAWLKAGQFNSNTTEWTLLQAYEAACAAILADFPAVLTVDMPADNGWSYSTMIGPDGIHPNDRGVAYITDKTEGILRAALTAYQQGLHQITTSTNAAAYTAPIVAYVGPGATAPAQVTGFTATTGQIISFSWTRPTDGGSTLTGYVIQSSPAGAATWTTLTSPAPTATSASVGSGLTASTSYDFRIAAINSIGTGAYSATSTATTGAPVVTHAADTFTRADGAVGSTETGAYAWASVGGTNSITANALKFDTVSVAGNGATVLINDGQSNGTFQLTRKNNGSGSPGLFFRGDATSFTGYVFWQSGTTYTLSKRTAQAAYTQLATAAGVSPVVGDVITVITNGSSITVKINGTQVISVTDASYSGTYHGSWSQAVGSVDDFSHTSATS